MSCTELKGIPKRQRVLKTLKNAKFHGSTRGGCASLGLIAAPGAQGGNVEWKPSGMLNKNTIYHSLTNPALLWGKKTTPNSNIYLTGLSSFGFCQWCPK